tara:strand:+ start:321 stop:545 length:225 start_codon:yes stop_codon:yes gene_type:complete
MTETVCRVCSSEGYFDGLLFKCSQCTAVHWDKWKIKKSFSKLKKDSEEFKTLKIKFFQKLKFRNLKEIIVIRLD